VRIPRSFRGRVALVALAALAIRLAWVWYMRHYTVEGDALVFNLDARHLADGLGFRRAFEPTVPTAEHPPLFILVLAGLDVLGATGFNAHRCAMAVVGAGTVVAIGVLARAVLGDRLALIAAGLAAVYPMLWTVDASLMSETPYALIVTLTILAAYRYRAAARSSARSSRWRR
jgi:4-amino-4-deoxy-L-arabinose transferase-like glycosyltransferase